MHQEQTKAWYKQFWPWFLIALPGSVVIASIATIIIASHKPDGIVVDDYYKAGLAINRNLSREQQAEHLDVRSTLQLTDNGHWAQLDIHMRDHTGPATLLLRLLHPTLPDKDQHITLARTSATTYRGKIQPISNGEWNVIVSSENPSWRIQRRININNSNNQYPLR